MRYRLQVVIRFFCIVCLAPSLDAQSVSRVGQGRIAVHADDVTLTELFDDLAKVVVLEKLILDPDVKEVTVSVKIEDAPEKEAIREILKAAKVDFTLWGGEGEPFRIYAGRGGNDRVGAPTTPAQEPDAFEEEALVPEPESSSEELQPPSFGEEGNRETQPDPAEPRGGGAYTQGRGPGSAQTPRGGRSASPPQIRATGNATTTLGDAFPATGGATLVTDDASISRQPKPWQMLGTALILGFGLVVGAILLGGPSRNRWNFPS